MSGLSVIQQIGSCHIVLLGDSIFDNAAYVPDGMPVGTVGEALYHLGKIRNNFQQEYRKMLGRVISANLPVIVCTIYNMVPGIGDVEKTALALFNEIILQEAAMANVAVIDLRIVCNEAEDFSPISPIEPSHLGGAKIAGAVYSILEV